MPELPEVETIRAGLANKILGKRIKKVSVNFSGTIKNNQSQFLRILTGNKFTTISRKGKLLIFKLDQDERFLLVHLKMTGQLIYCHGDSIVAGGHSLPKLLGCFPNKHTRVNFTFADNSNLFFNDLRKFGYLKLVNEKELATVIAGFGPEPLATEFQVEKLADIFKTRQAPIKAVLLNQKLIAGIGNIYADEILYAAGVLPNRPARELKPKEIKAIFTATRKILKKAIKYRGTTFNDYADDEGKMGGFSQYLRVYGRADKKCLICGNLIKKMKVAGRGTHFCPVCQY